MAEQPTGGAQGQQGGPGGPVGVGGGPGGPGGEGDGISALDQAFSDEGKEDADGTKDDKMGDDLDSSAAASAAKEMPVDGGKEDSADAQPEAGDDGIPTEDQDDKTVEGGG